MFAHPSTASASGDTRTRVVCALALAVVAAAAVAAVVRAPDAFRTLDVRAAKNDHETSIGRLIQATDSLGIENDFAIQALSLVPPNATYVLEQPQSDSVAAKYGISPTTLLALRGYMRFLLLPRREAPPSRAQYLLCYACDTDAFDKRGMKRLWSDPNGIVIGQLHT
jgi:hypothetical protein